MSGTADVARRGTVGAGIVLAHLGFVAVLVSAGVVRTPTIVPAVSVTFLQQEDRPVEPAQLEQPDLTPIHAVLVPPPRVDVAIEPDTAAISATAVEMPLPAPPAATPSNSGTAVIPEISQVAYVVQPTPRYPTESRRIREQGMVVLRVLIDESGHAKIIDIYKSSGHPRLDEAARDAVARAVFKPYIDGGTARAAAALVPVEFTLRAPS